MNNSLDSGIKLVKNVGRYNIGSKSIQELRPLLDSKRTQALIQGGSDAVVFLVDNYFKNDDNLESSLCFKSGDAIEFIDTQDEPTTEAVDCLAANLIIKGYQNPVAIVGMGGGCTLDFSKAISNLLTNGGKAEHYQGWDLVKMQGIFKVGIPTISGTGSEATRTCVMTNTKTGLKLGMNSDFTVFDHVILDPDLTQTVPRNQYFYTGMDAYIHCIESLGGSYRNAIGDAYSRETINLCTQVFLGDDMQLPLNRERLMVASYLGGCAIATSYVGLIHPLSAALSVVLGVHHCIGNCIVMNAMADYYPEAYDKFFEMAEKQGIAIPIGVCNGLNDAKFEELFNATIVHEKPLTNALGDDYRLLLTLDAVTKLFKRM
jgi:3-deoxy-alpha-D-manno-octulosonate 8-oxidase